MTALGGVSAAGLVDPVGGSQAVFRAALAALAHPGRIVTVTEPPASPPPLSPVMAALILTLADHETPVWLDAALSGEELRSYLRFHCGCPLTDRPTDAVFALIGDPQAAPDLGVFNLGSDQYPDRSTTILVEVETLSAPGTRRLTGPGLKTERRLDIIGPPPRFWRELQANHAAFPLGVDVFFCCSDKLAALPRSTKLEND